ncbi:TPA: antA/AntB antirepressor family protein, partial [Klebsiella pneumoniae]
MTQKKLTVLTGSGRTQPESNQKDISSNNFASRIPVIISNIGGKEIQSVSGRNLHTFLAVGRDFTNWIKGRIKQYGFVEGVDYVIVEYLTSPKRASSKSRQRIEHDYIVSLNMGKELSMVERNEQGKTARQYFI